MRPTALRFAPVTRRVACGDLTTFFAVAAACLAAAPAHAGPLPAPTNIDNYYLRGTQAHGLAEEILIPDECSGCHSQPIFDDWSGSLMAQSARDPVFYACLDIAEADAPGSGDLCIRCHVPKAWLEGRSTPTDGSAINRADRDGIMCNVCHRMVDPFHKPGAPMEDLQILMDLASDAPMQSMDLGTPSQPGDGGNAGYVISPFDSRRGPFPLAPVGKPPQGDEADCELFHFGVDTFESVFHRRSDICATCHDVSFPHFTLNRADGSYPLNDPGDAHPTGNKYEMFPEQRTYSEWLRSSFAQGMGVNMGGRFGGPGQEFVSQCQDCHMPNIVAPGCDFVEPRTNLPRHVFKGASTWQLDAIAAQFGQNSGLPAPEVNDLALAANKQRNIEMLHCAASIEAELIGATATEAPRLRVRVTNQTGHKLPTGYAAGRRMWVLVEFFDCADDETPFFAHGSYDFENAELDSASTRVYEKLLGLDEELAEALGRTAGPSFHSALSNECFFDNRIPPRGFTNAGFAAVQAQPKGHVYADGQFWDDTVFDVPGFSVAARATLMYQATSKEYIEFLRDENPNPGNPNNRGQVAFDLWEANGKSAPIAMAVFPEDPDDGICGDPDDDDLLLFDVELKGDCNGDRRVDGDDIQPFVAALAGGSGEPRADCAADMDGSGAVNGLDIPLFIELLIGG